MSSTDFINLIHFLHDKSKKNKEENMNGKKLLRFVKRKDGAREVEKDPFTTGIRENVCVCWIE